MHHSQNTKTLKKKKKWEQYCNKFNKDLNLKKQTKKNKAGFLLVL